MGILFGLIRQIRYWDAASKWALGIALALLVLALVLLTSAPADVRDAALIGVVGLLVVVQLIVLWGNRGMVTPYTQAQRQFIAGDFTGARDTLEAHIAALASEGKPADADTLVLLGNTYRNLSGTEPDPLTYLDALTYSEHLLTKAVQLQPSYHFPLYGLGRTLLAKGDYANAAHYLQQALAHGAPTIAHFDLGHAYYRLGKLAEARAALLAGYAAAQQEPHRALMTRYLLLQIARVQPDQAANDLGEISIDETLLAAGLPFWVAEAARYAHTPYGQAIQADVQALEN